MGTHGQAAVTQPSPAQVIQRVSQKARPAPSAASRAEHGPAGQRAAPSGPNRAAARENSPPSARRPAGDGRGAQQAWRCGPVRRRAARAASPTHLVPPDELVAALQLVRHHGRPQLHHVHGRTVAGHGASSVAAAAADRLPPPPPGRRSTARRKAARAHLQHRRPGREGSARGARGGRPTPCRQTAERHTPDSGAARPGGAERAPARGACGWEDRQNDTKSVPELKLVQVL